MADIRPVTVAVRFRPRPDSKPISDMYLLHPSAANVLVRDPLGAARDQEFAFDAIYDERAEQERLWNETARPMCDRVLEGKSASYFILGQPSSGRKHTALGDRKGPGIIPHILTYLTREIERKKTSSRAALFFSLFQIFPDHVEDCVSTDPHISMTKRQRSQAFDWGDELSRAPSGATSPERPAPKSLKSARSTAGFKDSAKALRRSSSAAKLDMLDMSSATFLPRRLEVGERPDGSANLSGLSVVRMTATDDIDFATELYSRSQEVRDAPGTHSHANKVDPRVAHTVFQITLLQESKRATLTEGKHISHFNVVLLADLENHEDLPSKDAAAVTRSMGDLTKALVAMSKGDVTYVAYKVSRLTHLLQHDLDVGCLATLLATINPTEDNFAESVRILTTASRCLYVQDGGHVDPARDKDLLITKLVKEMAVLKKENSELKDAQSKYMQHTTFSRAARSTPPTLTSSTIMQSSSDLRATQVSSTDPNAEFARAIESLQEEKEELHSRLQAKKKDFVRVQKHVTDLEAKRASDAVRHREEIATLRAELETNSQQHATVVKSIKDAHKTTTEKMAANHREELSSQHTLLTNAMRDMRISSRKTLEMDTIRHTAAVDAHAEAGDAIRSLETSHRSQLEETRKQFAEQLTGKTQELAAAAKARTRDAEAHARQVADLTAQIHTLYEYTERLAGLIIMVEAGTYPVHEKSGVKTVKLPRLDPGAPLDRTVLAAIEASSRQAAVTLRRHGDGSEINEGRRVFTPDSSMAASRSQGTVTPAGGAAATAVSRAPSMPRAARGSTGGDDHEVLRQRVFDDLHDDNTVQYIKHLETEVDRYRSLLLTEQRRSHELRIAYDAMPRPAFTPMAPSNATAGPRPGTARPPTGPAYQRSQRPATSGTLRRL